jgi:serine/threonine protein kinase
MPLEINSLLYNRYRILELLASGGMGAVYRGYDENLTVQVAIKENLFVSPAAGRQFMREARLLASLRHPGLPRVTDHFEIPGQGQYIVMDFIPGENAHTRMRRRGGKPLPEETVLQWAQEIMQALEYMHSRPQPVIHRDIKPGNIKITPEGEAILVDFGLAKVHDPKETTTIGARAYTPGFAPPEQYGQGSTDTRTDVFSLAATLYSLLTGRIPADSIKREMGAERLIPIRDLNPLISPHVAQAIERAIRTQPEERFQSIREFKEALFPSAASAASIAADKAIPKPAETSGNVLSSATTILRDRKQLRSKLWIPMLLLIVIAAAVLLPGILQSQSSPPGSAQSTDSIAAMLPTLQNTVPPSDTTESLPVIDTPQIENTATATIEITDTPSSTPVGSGGGLIAFASDREGVPQVFLINADGSGVQQFTDTSDGACQPAWSPDGQQLLYISPCNGKKDNYPNAVIYRADISGGTPFPLITKVGGVFDPQWTQAGISFTHLDDNRPSVWLADESGGNAVRVSRENSYDRQASWSPDAEKVAILNTSGSSYPVVYWFYQDGSYNGATPDQVTRDQHAHTPSWSPDGETIAYAASNHIWIIQWDALGYGKVRLTELGPNDDPNWSPDGEWIVFESWRDNANHEIYLMTANGGSPTRLTDHPAVDFQPAWQP